MKKLLYISFLALVAVFFIQCDSVDDLMTENALEGGLVDISVTGINYVVGSGSAYTFDLFVHQEGDVKIETINFYKSCFYAAAIPWSDPNDTTHATADSVAAKYTDEILEHTIAITEKTKSHSIATRDWTWEDLREGLTQEDGNELPLTDATMEIGNYFQFRVEAVLSDGRVVNQNSNVRMTVSTRYAGTYKCIEAEYYRIGVPTYTAADWPAVTAIESVDAITYKIVEYFGAFDGNTFYMQIDAAGKITYPAEWAGVAQVGNGEPMITCESNPADMTNVPCGALSNYVVNDDVEGKDKLYMTFGYYTGGSGPREFYQVMEKIPN